MSRPPVIEGHTHFVSVLAHTLTAGTLQSISKLLAEKAGPTSAIKVTLESGHQLDPDRVIFTAEEDR